MEIEVNNFIKSILSCAKNDARSAWAVIQHSQKKSQHSPAVKIIRFKSRAVARSFVISRYEYCLWSACIALPSVTVFSQQSCSFFPLSPLYPLSSEAGSRKSSTPLGNAPYEKKRQLLIYICFKFKFN